MMRSAPTIALIHGAISGWSELNIFDHALSQTGGQVKAGSEIVDINSTGSLGRAHSCVWVRDSLHRSAVAKLG
jgi:hypothetical protein